MKYKRGPVSLLLLVIFFGSGALICFITLLGLAFPGGFLEPIWQLHPDAKIEFQKLGHWSIALMAAVCAACGLARKAKWGHRLAVGILVLNLIGDTFNAVLRQDLRDSRIRIL